MRIIPNRCAHVDFRYLYIMLKYDHLGDIWPERCGGGPDFLAYNNNNIGYISNIFFRYFLCMILL